MVLYGCSDPEIGLNLRREQKERSCQSRFLPERALDRPGVAPSEGLELVCVCELKRLAVPQPDNIREVLLLAPRTLQSAAHLHSFAQRRDDDGGTLFKLQIFEFEKEEEEGMSF